MPAQTGCAGFFDQSSAVALANGYMKSMFHAKLTSAAVAMIAACVSGTGLGFLASTVLTKEKTDTEDAVTNQGTNRVSFTHTLSPRQTSPPKKKIHLHGCSRAIMQNARLLLLSFLCGLTTLTLDGATEMQIPDATRPLSLEEIKAQLRKQQQNIESMHLRIRRTTKLSMDPKIMATWPSQPALPEYLGTDEILVAFKENKRYFRLLGLDYRSNPFLGSIPQPVHDHTKVWTGKSLRLRSMDWASGNTEYSTPKEEGRDSFPPTPYLMNAGLAVPDPTASGEAFYNLQRLYLLAECVHQWPYALQDSTQQVEGTPCVVLEGRIECLLPGSEAPVNRIISDKVWLDPAHGLALRKRETRIAGQLVRVFNSDFEEVMPHVWLPKRTRSDTFPPADAPNQYHDQPMFTEEAALCLWVVNRVPDKLFEIAATQATTSSEALPDNISAFHGRIDNYFRRSQDPRHDNSDETFEAWWVRDVGQRTETRKGTNLVQATIYTTRWRFEWDATRKRVTATPSQLGKPHEELRRFLLPARDNVFREMEEVNTAIFAAEKDSLDGREADKITVYQPPDPGFPKLRMHGFQPRLYLRLPGTVFPGRTYWFDTASGLPLQRRCGCIRPLEAIDSPSGGFTHDERIDYPDPNSVPKDLFTFHVPPDAQLVVEDPALGRHLRSDRKGETGRAE